MLATTIKLLRVAFEADPSIGVAERQRLLLVLRNGETAAKPETTTESVARIIRRAEAASRLGVSLRTLDKFCKDGALAKRVLPNRKRAAGILESDLNALIAGKANAQKEAA